MLTMKTRIAIIEPDAQLRESYKLIIGGTNQFTVVATYGDFIEAQDAIRKTPIDMIVMELDLPYVSGTEAAKVIRERYPHIKIVMMSSITDPAIVIESLRAGVSGYLLKKTYTELVTAIQQTVSEGAYLSPSIAKAVVESYHLSLHAPVTQRERQILALLSQGKTYSEIAEELCIAQETSKTHIRNIYQKLKVNSKSQAIAKATEERWI